MDTMGRIRFEPPPVNRHAEDFPQSVTNMCNGLRRVPLPLFGRDELLYMRPTDVSKKHPAERRFDVAGKDPCVEPPRVGFEHWQDIGFEMAVPKIIERDLYARRRRSIIDLSKVSLCRSPCVKFRCTVAKDHRAMDAANCAVSTHLVLTVAQHPVLTSSE